MGRNLLDGAAFDASPRLVLQFVVIHPLQGDRWPVVHRHVDADDFERETVAVHAALHDFAIEFLSLVETRDGVFGAIPNLPRSVPMSRDTAGIDGDRVIGVADDAHPTRRLAIRDGAITAGSADEGAEGET